MDPQSVKRRLTCILAADAVGYSQQMGRDEEGTIRVLTAHRAVIDGLIDFHGGRIISTAGDSVLAEFSSAVEAVRCAVEIQDALKTSNDALPEDRRMYFRVGVNLGDVVVKNQDLLGDGVNVAARLETIAEPGGICISSSVYDQITGKLDLGFQDIGEQALKNISRPIRVYRVSGTGVPLRPPLAVQPRRSRRPFPWGIAAAALVAVAAAVAWQAGWLHFGATPTERSAAVKDAPPGVPPAKSSAATAAPAPTPAAPAATSPAPAAPATPAATPPATVAGPGGSPDARSERLLADVEALRKQARDDLARARSETVAARAVRTQAEAEVAASRMRAQAEADAARVRTEAEAARSKMANAPATKDAEAPAAKAPATAAAGTRFDGNWTVMVACESAQENAAAYKIDFVAQVKDSFFRGERRSEGVPGWVRLQGPIQADGSAMLEASGLTDDPRYALKNVAAGSRYVYHVAAHFDGNRGNGRRVEQRSCDFQFARQ